MLLSLPFKSELELFVFWSTPYSFISSQIAICSRYSACTASAAASAHV